jgi:hypothetical protein
MPCQVPAISYARSWPPNQMNPANRLSIKPDPFTPRPQTLCNCFPDRRVASEFALNIYGTSTLESTSIREVRLSPVEFDRQAETISLSLEKSARQK